MNWNLGILDRRSIEERKRRSDGATERRRENNRPIIAFFSSPFVAKSLRRYLAFQIFAILLLASISCQSNSAKVAWAGPKSPAPIKYEPWTYRGLTGQTLITPHYVIHTTIDEKTIKEEDFLSRLAQTMEGAYQQYESLCPSVKPSSQPMECWIFSSRPEWAMFTKEHTGAEAVTYLKINRGGYTIRDWFVAYFLGDAGTFAVSAHEGWHQFVARHFKNRLPPFMEEGIATQFENIHWSKGLPQWNLSINANRAQRLRQAIDGKYMWPLEKLVTMHAGDVVGLGGEKIEAFYAQDWAFVRFLWEGEGGKYRPAFQKLIADTAAGTIDDPTGIIAQLPPNTWRPQSVKPVLERYLGKDLGSIDTEYQAFVKVMAFDRFNEQWQAN
jgi:hypothetical protein